MDKQRQRLPARREAMVAGGFWRDETLLDHLTRAAAARPGHTAIVARRSETGEETRLTEVDHRVGSFSVAPGGSRIAFAARSSL